MPENILTIDQNCWIITNDKLSSEIDLQWFDDKYWLNQGRLLGASSGRGSAWMVKSYQDKMMLRHYYRGGIPAKFNQDKYFWTGLNSTRSFSEYRLLTTMFKLNLPVPKPIAASVCKVGFFYQANILIQYIMHTATFAAVLNTPTASEVWEKVGQTIADFHNYGIFHADLNTHNILITSDKIFLIDFDHSNQRTIKSSWRQANLKRLKRSIDKLTNNDYITKNNEHWHKLLTAYNSVIK
ncbi:MAG: 3-deoxy-D-manno-octulosonic acid kinase [Proteobacteria bacterium]|nr:3-deoxy-D-manno-octulosonic acid kinase [Pseudomonadota bacterium]